MIAAAEVRLRRAVSVARVNCIVDVVELGWLMRWGLCCVALGKVDKWMIETLDGCEDE